MPAGWTGRILFYDLSKHKARVWEYGGEMARKFIGGRGFAAKILWDMVPRGADPLGPENKLVFAAGPLTGLPGPSTGKLVIAAKSPLTGGYGDGNVGSVAAVQMRRAGFDAVVVEGASKKPVYLLVEKGKAEVFDAEDLWGLDTFEAERRLKEKHGKTAGVLLIGPAGENLVNYAVVASQEGRAGGRPGMGAVMGSKKLKAVVFVGDKEPEVADPEGLRKLASEAREDIKSKPMYNFWIRQGTMAAVQWSQENSVLPTKNFSEGIFEGASAVDGYAMEKIKTHQRGCPFCNMPCGNVVEDAEGNPAELDYENVALLGPNLLIGDLKKIAVLNRMLDKLGLDTIGAGNSVGFAMEAKEKGLLKEGPEWGDYEAVKELLVDIAYKRGDLGRLLSKGVKRASEEIGGSADLYAVHVKGLEVTGYDCHAAPAMALAYGTSPIGAHHKDAWIISWEVKTDRLAYTREKVEKLIWMQRIRGGIFESMVSCRLPWIELGFELEWYPKLFKAATGVSMTIDDMFEVADRIYTLIRAYWVREYSGWSREYDRPPRKWFEIPLSKGPYSGAKLDPEKYEEMLSWYYEARGWDERGVPRKSTLGKLGLGDVAAELEKITPLKE